MAKRPPANAPPANDHPFESDPHHRPESGEGDSNTDDGGIDDMEFDAGPEPVGIQGVMFHMAKKVKTEKGEQIIIEIELEAPEFDGRDPLKIWLKPPGDNARIKAIVRAFGGSWDNTRNRPADGWASLRGRRARAIVGIWEKNDGSIETQVSKYPPMFSNTDDTVELRAAFLESCKAAGVQCELKQIAKGKHVGKWQAKGKVFNSCGILSLAAS